jgi:hypothetical protein
MQSRHSRGIYIPSRFDKINWSTQSVVRQRDGLRLLRAFGGEAEEELFVGEHIFEHRPVKRWIFGRILQIVGSKSGKIKESA